MSDRWIVETSHMVVVPPFYDATDHLDLLRQLQETADNKRPRVDRPPIGPLTWDVRCIDGVTRFHAYFTGSNGTRRRFMRLLLERKD